MAGAVTASPVPTFWGVFPVGSVQLGVSISSAAERSAAQSSTADIGADWTLWTFMRGESSLIPYVDSYPRPERARGQLPQAQERRWTVTPSPREQVDRYLRTQSACGHLPQAQERVRPGGHLP